MREDIGKQVQANMYLYKLIHIPISEEDMLVK